MTRHTVDIGLATVRHAYLHRAGGGHAQLIVLRLSHNHLYSGHTVWQGQSNQYSTNPLNSSPPLHYSTYLVNLGQWIHILQIHWGCALGQKSMVSPQCWCASKKATIP